jgi:hypothetical protein
MARAKMIDFRGRRVIAGWPEMLAESQKSTHVIIGGKKYRRVRYGKEADDWGSEEHPCRDCAAIAGEYHGFGCCVERCPGCGGQAASCECDYDDDDNAVTEVDVTAEPASPLKPKKCKPKKGSSGKLSRS